MRILDCRNDSGSYGELLRPLHQCYTYVVLSLKSHVYFLCVYTRDGDGGEACAMVQMYLVEVDSLPLCGFHCVNSGCWAGWHLLTLSHLTCPALPFCTRKRPEYQTHALGRVCVFAGTRSTSYPSPKALM